ncbi:MAG: hypothetical protein H7338_23925 [Candidatus Sericytochromatia bacterium]|nr:hypothetical protein [Candidatus Sericytochromatia bacterium]
MKRLTVGLVLSGMVMAGCTGSPTVAPATATMPVAGAAAAGQATLSADIILMPPTAATLAFLGKKSVALKNFKALNPLTAVSFMPGTHTLRMLIDGKPAGVLVSANAPYTLKGGRGNYVYTAGLSANGDSLGLDSTFTSGTPDLGAKHTLADLGQPKVSEDPLHFGPLQDAPPTLLPTLTALHASQASAVQQNLPKREMMTALTDYALIREIRYKNQLVGYLDTQISGSSDGQPNFEMDSLQLVNVLDPQGKAIYSQCQMTNSHHNTKFAHFPLQGA